MEVSAPLHLNLVAVSCVEGRNKLIFVEYFVASTVLGTFLSDFICTSTLREGKVVIPSLSGEKVFQCEASS